MINHFRERLQFIEEAFGRGFLTKNTDHETSKKFHPIRRHWTVAKDFLDRMPSGEQDLRNSDLAKIVDIADAIEAVRGIPGYVSEIRDELMKPNKFGQYERTLYELSSAAAYIAHAVGEVEFVVKSRNGTKRPDLKISRGGDHVWVECTRRDPVRLNMIRASTSDAIVREVDRLMNKIGPALDVEIILPGLKEEQIVQALDWLCETIKPNESGLEYARTDLGVLAIVSDAPMTQIVPVEGGFEHRAELRHGASFSRLNLGTIDISQPPMARPVPAVSLFSFPTHSFREIKSTFDVKRRRKQIPESEVGVIHIDADLSAVHGAAYPRSLRAMARLLGYAAWRGVSNSRIGGLVVSCSGAMLEEEREGVRFYRTDGVYWLTRRDFGSNQLPDWFKT